MQLERFEAGDAAEMRSLGEQFAQSLRAGDVVVLTGPLGAGKTTLVQGIATGLGVRGPITSPTFVIARMHESTSDGPNLVHVDAYRLNSMEEVQDLDLETTADEAVTVVEWGEGKAEFLSSQRIIISIDRDVQPRSIVIQRSVT